MQPRKSPVEVTAGRAAMIGVHVYAFAVFIENALYCNRVFPPDSSPMFSLVLCCLWFVGMKEHCMK